MERTMQDMTTAADLEPLDDGYPPDMDDDRPGVHVPVPRSKQVKRPLQRGKSKTKKPGPLDKRGTRILAQQKRRQALELRKAGATYEQIAQSVGYHDASAAHKAVMKAFGQVIQEPVSDLKRIQIERLNHMLVVLWPQVNAGDRGAMQTALMVMNKIDALEGTEAAKRVEVQHGGGVLVVDGDSDEYQAALKRMAGMVDVNGHNTANQPVAAAPGTPALPQGKSYPPGMGPKEEDVVDAEIVEDDGGSLADHLTDEAIDTIHKIMAPPDPDPASRTLIGAEEPITPQPTLKKRNWGVDPVKKS